MNFLRESDHTLWKELLAVLFHLLQPQASVPGLNIELTGPLFIIIELPGIVDPGSGRGHMPDESHRVGAHRREAGGEIVVAFRHPVKLPVQVPPQKFLGVNLGLSP